MLSISIPVPQPTVRVVPQPNTTQLFTTQQLNITCHTVLHPAVDTPVGVANTWSGPSGVMSSDGHITVTGVAGTDLEFNSALRFSSLQSSDSGSYTCFSTVSLVSSYIASGDTVSASIVVTASKCYVAIGSPPSLPLASDWRRVKVSYVRGCFEAENWVQLRNICKWSMGMV